MKTKLFKRLGATVLALGMALSVMAIPTSAAEIDGTGSLTVNNIQAGDTVTIYQLTSYNFNADYNQPQAPVHSWIDAVAEWLADSNYSTYANADGTVNTGENGFVSSDNLAIDSGNYGAFYAALEKAIDSGDLTLTPIQEEAVATIDEPVEYYAEFTNLNMGVYLVLVDSEAVGVVYNPAAAYIAPEFDEVTGSWTVTSKDINAKSTDTPPAPEKDVDTSNGTSIGDTVTYTISYALDDLDYPEYSTYKTFKLTDTMTDGLDLCDENGFTVYGLKTVEEEVVRTPLAEVDGYYSLEVSNATDEDSFEIDFNYDLLEDNGYEAIEVIYTAVINENAIVNGETNSVILEYNPNPNVSQTSQTDPTEVDVYNYKIIVDKYATGSVDTKLSGAVFELYFNGAKLNFTVNNDGYYVFAPVAQEGVTTTELTTNDSGAITIVGLEKGVYTLTEIKAPDGYVLPNNVDRTVTIADSDDDGSVEDNGAEQNTDTVTVGIDNTSSSDAAPSLPTTGGMGTILFTTVGLVLVGGAAILLVVMYKRKKEN